MATRIIAAALAVALAPAWALADWNAHGPAGGYAYGVAQSGDELFVGTDDGIYQAANGTFAWQRTGDLPRGIRVESVAVSPGDPDVMLAGGYTSFRTTDGGVHWTTLPVAFDEVAFNKIVPNHVVAVRGSQSSSDHVLFCSNDGGATFNQTSLEAAAAIADATSGSFIAIDMSNNVYKSDGTDACVWTPVGSATAFSTPIALLQDPLDSNAVFISTVALDASYLYRFDLSTGTTTTALYVGGAAYVDPFQPMRVWLTGFNENEASLALFESTDGGATWPEVVSGVAASLIGADSQHVDTLFGSQAAGFSVSEDAGRTWDVRADGIPLSSVNAVSIRPDAPGEIVAAHSGGIAFSTDGGMSWTAADTSPPAKILSLARAPGDASIVYAGRQWGGFYRSVDSGRNWEAMTPADDYYSYVAVAVDRADANKLAAVRASSVAWSEDGGATWMQATVEGGANPDFRSFGRNSYGSGAVYALAWLHNDVFAVYRAPAHGQPFAPIAPGMNLNALAVSPSSDRLLFATVHDDTYTTTTAYISADGGETWTPRSTFDNPDYVSIQFDACDARTVYLQGFNVLRVSHDLGLTWTDETADLPFGITNDMDVRCTNGTRSIAVATYAHGAEVRDPEFVDAILGDGFDGD